LNGSSTITGLATRQRSDTTLQFTKNFPGKLSVATVAVHINRRLYIQGQDSKHCFLVDMGAEVSMLLATKISQEDREPSLQLQMGVPFALLRSTLSHYTSTNGTFIVLV